MKRNFMKTDPQVKIFLAIDDIIVLIRNVKCSLHEMISVPFHSEWATHVEQCLAPFREHKLQLLT